MDALGIARAVVGGVSMGGYVSLAFAARHAKRMSGLVLADTKAGPDTPEARAARDEAITLVREQGVAAYVEKQLPRFLAATAPDELRGAGALAGPTAPRGGGGRAGGAPGPSRSSGRAGVDRMPHPGAGGRAGRADRRRPRPRPSPPRSPTRSSWSCPTSGHLANLEAPSPFVQAIGGFLGASTL
jgi:pimeloyl-ACP methyl ester carboxylesterase